MKEEFSHDCEMDVPSCLSAAQELQRPPLPQMTPADNYRATLPPLTLPKSPPTTVAMYSNVPMSPNGEVGYCTLRGGTFRS